MNVFMIYIQDRHLYATYIRDDHNKRCDNSNFHEYQSNDGTVSSTLLGF